MAYQNNQDKMSYFSQSVGADDFTPITNGPNIEDYPTTISRTWIKIGEMANLYRYNPKFQANIDKLYNDKHVIAWKKSRGDGNCYFRAVITRYFELIHKIYAPVEELVYFKRLIKGSKFNRYEQTEYFSARKVLLKYLKNAISMKMAGNGLEVFVEALKILQDREFDLNLVRVSRLITAATLEREKDSEDIFPFVIDDYEFIFGDILEMGKEGGELTLIILPKALNIQIIQFMYLDNDMNIQEFPNSVPRGTKQVFIVRRSGHYDILCMVQEMELDQFTSEDCYYLCKNPAFYKEMLEMIYSNS